MADARNTYGGVFYNTLGLTRPKQELFLETNTDMVYSDAS